MPKVPAGARNSNSRKFRKENVLQRGSNAPHEVELPAKIPLAGNRKRPSQVISDGPSLPNAWVGQSGFGAQSISFRGGSGVRMIQTVSAMGAQEETAPEQAASQEAVQW